MRAKERQLITLSDAYQNNECFAGGVMAAGMTHWNRISAAMLQRDARSVADNPESNNDLGDFAGNPYTARYFRFFFYIIQSLVEGDKPRRPS
jgi:hypothetical protein